MKKPLFLLILLLFFSSSYSQFSFSPNIYNYSIAEYKAGNQNWDICRNKDGKVYVANNMGLLEFDGMDWKLFQLPNKTTIRSVSAYEDIIFTGSFEEFGYWKKDEYGELNYYSLSDSIKDKISPNEEIWQIVNFKDEIYFRSFSSIYIYDFKTLKQLKPNSVVISLSLVEENVLVSTLNNGIFKLDNKKLKPFFNDDSLKDTKVISIVKKDDQYLLLTSLKGSFYLNNKALRPTTNSINDIIKQHQLNKFSQLANGDMIFGTIKDGVYVTDQDYNIKYHISKENGLNNNTVLGQFVDDDNNLWLGLDNGIATVNLKDAEFFQNYTSDKLGAVYDVIIHQGLLYIGTNIGLFYLDKSNDLQFIDGSQGQVWDLSIIDNDLLCGHNDGTFLVDKNSFKKISDFTGGWTIKKVPEKENEYVQGTYTGLVKFQKNIDGWVTKHLGNTTIPSRFLVFEDPTTAWVAHTYKGIYKFDFNKSLDTITKVTNYSLKGIESEYNLRLYRIKNDIVFKTNSGWQKYEPLLDSIVPFKILNEKLGKEAYIISENSTNPLVLKDKNEIIKLNYVDNGGYVKKINKKHINNQFVVNYEKVSRIDSSLFALNLYNGFTIINENFEDNSIIKKPIVESIKINNKKVKLENINKDDELNLSYGDSLNIEFSSAKSTDHYFEYHIPSLNKEWVKVNNRNLILNNINYGDFKLLVRTKDYSENTSNPQEFYMNVSPPWYNGVPGMVLYVFILIGVIVLFYYLHQKKIRKEQQTIRQEYQIEQQKLLKEKEIENEKKIVKIKNDNLQNELKIKSKQLANNAMALVKKNETLQDIKNELVINKENFKNNYLYKKVIRKLDNSIEHKNEWKVFEENFNQVHDEYFIKLKHRHPDLTPKDLKICAYIKMKLATKEIAPLMNITVRGVETHRYRLKKKINLESESSLTDYLLNFK